MGFCGGYFPAFSGSFKIIKQENLLSCNQIERWMCNEIIYLDNATKLSSRIQNMLYQEMAYVVECVLHNDIGIVGA